MATKESEVASNEHPSYQHADGTNGHDLGRQISVTLTPQQFEGEFLDILSYTFRIWTHLLIIVLFITRLYRAVLAAQHQVQSPNGLGQDIG